MRKSGPVQRLMSFIGSFFILSIATIPSLFAAETEGIEPRAKELLTASTSYLAGQQRFRVNAHSTIEAVLTSGQKIQFDHGARLSVQRPNKLRAERHGDLVDQVFYYDGQTLTLNNPRDKVYATLSAPATLEEMLDFARETLDLVAPGADLVYSNAYEVLMEDVSSGFVVGKSVIGGVRCDHLAFRSPHADWQIWIQEGGQPVPRKLVITTLDVVNAPQFSVLMTGWDMAPQLSDETFAFIPPDDALGIDFLTVGGDVAKAK